MIKFLDGHRYEQLLVNLIAHKHNFAYLTYIFTKFKNVNKTLQGDNVTLIKAKSTMATFLGQFKIHYTNVEEETLQTSLHLALSRELLILNSWCIVITLRLLT